MWSRRLAGSDNIKNFREMIQSHFPNSKVNFLGGHSDIKVKNIQVVDQEGFTGNGLPNQTFNITDLIYTLKKDYHSASITTMPLTFLHHIKQTILNQIDQIKLQPLDINVHIYTLLKYVEVLAQSIEPYKGQIKTKTKLLIQITSAGK